MTVVFYHSVIYGLGFFICFKIKILQAQNNKASFLYVLYTDKTWVFDQSERAQCPTCDYIVNCNNYMLFAGWEVRIVKNCDRGLENAARGRRPRAAFSSPRSQFLTIRTDPKLANNYCFLR